MTTCRAPRSLLSLLLALLLLGGTLAVSALAQDSPTADQRVEALLQEDLDALMEAWPTWASVRGDRRFDDRLPDVSPAATAARLEDSRGRLARLEAIDRAALSPGRRLDAELLEHELRDRLESARFRPELLGVDHQSGPQVELPQLPERLAFESDEHLRAWLTRLTRIPAYLAQVEANLRAGLAEGRTPPRVVVERVPEQALSQGAPALAERPEEHALFAPFAGRSADDPLAARAREVIAREVVPAFRRLGEFLRDVYVPGCRTTIALRDAPDGEAQYAYLLRHYTTRTGLTAQGVHELGLREVARIRVEMLAVIARSDFPRQSELEGDALLAAFVEYLRRDPRFYHRTPEALLRGYRDVCKRMDAELPRLFGRLPRLPYGVREMPALIAPTAPTAYYYSGSLESGVPGYFVANTHRLDQRPTYEMVPLALHEAVPGHHLQIALAQELEETGLHEWRTLSGYTVFVEGWGLYAERLGLEVGGPPGGRGLYEDPYDDFGRLSYEMWRALRLVVDPGLHALGWSRQRAIEYMLQNSALTRENVEREVDRYIAWPGQAVAYKTGELAIRALRAEAEAALGPRFSRRAFHDVVLGAGAVPLEVLERRVRDWIERGGPGDPATREGR